MSIQISSPIESNRENRKMVIQCRKILVLFRKTLKVQLKVHAPTNCKVLNLIPGFSISAHVQYSQGHQNCMKSYWEMRLDVVRYLSKISMVKCNKKEIDSLAAQLILTSNLSNYLFRKCRLNLHSVSICSNGLSSLTFNYSFLGASVIV